MSSSPKRPNCSTGCEVNRHLCVLAKGLLVRVALSQSKQLLQRGFIRSGGEEKSLAPIAPACHVPVFTGLELGLELRRQVRDAGVIHNDKVCFIAGFNLKADNGRRTTSDLDAFASQHRHGTHRAWKANRRWGLIGHEHLFDGFEVAREMIDLGHAVFNFRQCGKRLGLPARHAAAHRPKQRPTDYHRSSGGGQQGQYPAKRTFGGRPGILQNALSQPRRNGRSEGFGDLFIESSALFQPCAKLRIAFRHCTRLWRRILQTECRGIEFKSGFFAVHVAGNGVMLVESSRRRKMVRRLSLARERRDITVPMGTPSVSAMSR